MGCFSSAANNQEELTVLPSLGTLPVIVQNQLHILLSDFDVCDLKLLIFGYEGAGIKTLFKQIRKLCGVSFSQSDREVYQKIIRINLIKDMQVLMDKIKLNENLYLTDVDNIHDAIMNLTYDDEEFSKDIIDGFLEIWNNPVTKGIYDEIKYHNLSPNSEYFFDEIQIIVSNNYIPSDLDIIKTKAKQITEEKLKVSLNGLNVELGYMGKKHDTNPISKYLQGMNYLLVVLSLQDFDLIIEDKNFIQMFSSISESPLFADKPVLVVLNKVDIFKQKVYDNPKSFSTTFPNFQGNINDYTECIKYITDEIINVRKGRKDSIEVFTSTIVDIDSVRELFQFISKRLTSDQAKSKEENSYLMPNEEKTEIEQFEEPLIKDDKNI